LSARENKLVVVGTVYPGIEAYLGDYFSSLANQSFSDFNVVLANDGLGEFDDVCRGYKLAISSLDVNGSVSSNRRSIIRHVLELGYGRIVFTDCDDTFESNRLEVVDALLDKAAIVVNDLDITDQYGAEVERRYFSPRFGDGFTVDESTIKAGNAMGLSNTAARSEVFAGSPAMASGDSIAFDWYLWASVFSRGYQARFTAETATRYRVYDANVAGLPQSLDDNNIRKGIEVKCQHYGLMSKISSEYAELYRSFAVLDNRLSDDRWRKAYISRLKENAVDHHMWWENIRAPSEVGLE
jgi:glycosyltransferase involved in cell wall biosynthesis